MGVVVRRYIDILIILLIPTPLVLALFCSSIPISVFIFFMFLFMLFLCNIANVAQRMFEIVQKSRSRDHGNIIPLSHFPHHQQPALKPFQSGVKGQLPHPEEEGPPSQSGLHGRPSFSFSHPKPVASEPVKVRGVV